MIKRLFIAALIIFGLFSNAYPIKYEYSKWIKRKKDCSEERRRLQEKVNKLNRESYEKARKEALKELESQSSKKSKPKKSRSKKKSSRTSKEAKKTNLTGSPEKKGWIDSLKEHPLYKKSIEQLDEIKAALIEQLDKIKASFREWRQKRKKGY